MGWNLATAWERVADEVPDADALICGDTVRSWREFEDRAARFAAALDRLGLGHRSMVGLALYNGNEYLETEFACFKQRCSPFNINYRYTAEELLALLLDADAEVVVFSPELAERLGEIRDEVPT
ncbi:MAG: AMP-binding protein, partial [Acidimicrobiales bacterium]|nr:AMP-binding protein [Acidimicrobiales bacterium]